MKARIIEFKVGQKKLLSEIVAKAKDVPCMDCGVKYPKVVMDFDHVRGDKKANVSKMVANTVSVETLQKEIDKCDVVCSNCHRLRTYKSTKLDAG